VEIDQLPAWFAGTDKLQNRAARAYKGRRKRCPGFARRMHGAGHLSRGLVRGSLVHGRWASARSDLDASGAQVAEQHIGVGAAQQDRVARHMRRVRLRDPHVGHAVRSEKDLAGARGQHAGAVDAIGARVCRLQPLRAQPESIQLHEIDAKGLPSPIPVPGFTGTSRRP
jgi:hypothetical protein